MSDELDEALSDSDECFTESPSGGPVSSCPEEEEPVPTLTLHLDADRDGVVDDDTSGLDSWNWGRGQKGAIILCNNDDDNSNRQIDHSNRVVDGGTDVPDLAPLVLRRNPPDLPFPAGWKARLSVSADDQNKIRIFDPRGGAGSDIIGSSRGRRHTITDLSPQEWLFGMEATQYASRTFDGLISITLEVINPGGSVETTRSGTVRVAPWLMPNHLWPTEQVYVVAFAGNRTFRDELRAAVTDAGVPAPMEASGRRYGDDRWMQDVMEVGFSSLPRSDGPATAALPADQWNMPVVLRTANDRLLLWGSRLDRFTLQELLGPDYGYTAPQTPTSGSSLDSFGNLECSPKVTVSGKEYKFGRIIYGQDSTRPMRRRIREFLIAQKVQEPFSIDTAWLEVGHVDEAISFCPTPGTSPGFKVLMASPGRALEILRDLQSRGEGSAPLFVGIPRSLGYRYRTVDQVLGDSWFVSVQERCQRKLDGIESTLRSNLGIDDPTNFIRFPVLFRWVRGAARPTYIAYTANAVNMLVVTKADGKANLCVPKPFGPVVGGECRFEADIKNELFPWYIESTVVPAPDTGKIFFIDDFITYHHLMGEIHCGTNSKRQVPTDQWWWEQEGI